MILIEEYIKLSKLERQKHLNLEEPCLERGGPKAGVSYYCKGLMAHVLDTTIPTGYKILLCHACNNGHCSNPNHLYWGTSSENCLDAFAHGKRTAWECVVDKYGLEEAKRRQANGSKSAGGKANRGIPKSVEHRQALSEATSRHYTIEVK